MPASFEQLYRSLREPVARLCLGVTRNRALAEDAVQETFLSVHRSLGGFRGEAKVETWVYQIALRAALRARARNPAAEGDVPEGIFDSAVADLEARDALRRVAAAMDALSTEHRMVLSLFAIEGLGQSEIAELLGIKEGTVWSRLHAARRRLAELLAEPPGRRLR